VARSFNNGVVDQRRGLCWQNAVELLHPSAGDGLFGRSGGRNYTLLEAAT